MNSMILVHHGIKGQKWGVENGPPYPLSDSAKSSAERKLTKNDKKKMSNDELRATNERMRLENEYDRQLAEWLKNNSGNVKKGKSFVERVVKTTSTAANLIGNANKIIAGLSSIDKLLGVNKFPHVKK